MFRRKPWYTRNVLLEDILLFSLFLPALNPTTLPLAALAVFGRYMYRYWGVTDFPEKKVQDESKKKIAISMDMMIDPIHLCGLNPLQQLNDDMQYTVYFASRPGFQDTFDLFNKMKSPVTHSSLAFKDPDGKYLIIGRQSPSCSLDQTLGWTEKMRMFGRQSIPCNEKPYMFSFAVINENNGVMFTGKEIKDAINTSTKEISHRGFDFFESNCYSFTINILCKLVSILDQRDPHENATTSNDFESLSDELIATKHHLGMGVVNNNEVYHSVEQAQKILQRRIPNKFIDHSRMYFRLG